MKSKVRKSRAGMESSMRQVGKVVLDGWGTMAPELGGIERRLLCGIDSRAHHRA